MLFEIFFIFFHLPATGTASVFALEHFGKIKSIRIAAKKCRGRHGSPRLEPLTSLLHAHLNHVFLDGNTGFFFKAQ